MNDQPFPTTAAISAIAGVSKSTASRALNNDPRISEGTRARIWAIAQDLGYSPNAIAQSLATQRSRIVCFIGSSEPNYWYQEKIQVRVRAVAAAGMQTMMFQVPGGADISGIVPEMVRYRLAGSIVIPTVKVTRSDTEALARYNIPIVSLNRRLAGRNAFSVACDQVSGARAMARLLIAAGHRRIALIAGPDTPTAVAREQGFVKELAAADRTLFSRADGGFSFERAHAGAIEMMRRKKRPDAIFAANDLMAFGVLDALRSLRVDVPGEVSVVGFDNGDVGAWPSYRLTTVAQPIEQMIDSAIATIVRHVQSSTPRSPATTTFDGELVLRDTARLPPVLPALPVSFRRE